MSSAADLPQLDGGLFLTDGGLETTLIFHGGIDLPLFASFTLLGDPEGERALREYFAPYLAVAAEREAGFVLDTATWRASPRWAEELGMSGNELDRANRRAVELIADLRDEYAGRMSGPIVLSGVVGPQDDGYQPQQLLSAGEAESYHAVQIRTFADTPVDLISAVTMTYADEAVGIVRAATAAGLPAVVSFTVETDGRLPSAQPLSEAIEEVESATGGGAAYYMINCAHPTHFDGAIDAGAPWTAKVRGIRANASTMSHAELDEAAELDEGDPDDLARRYVELADRLPNLNVLGGCCGTDARHVAAIGAAWRDAGR